MEESVGAASKENVPVLHADLREGRTYYVRIVRGADEAPPIMTGRWVRRCGSTSAMVVSPALDGWRKLPEWMTELENLVPDRAAGQAWLDGKRASLESHVAIGQERFAELRPQAKRLATIEATDSAPP